MTASMKAATKQMIWGPLDVECRSCALNGSAAGLGASIALLATDRDERTRSSSTRT